MLNWKPEDPSAYRDVQTIWNYEHSALKKSPRQRLERLWRSSRDNARTPVQWSDAPYAGFSTTQPWIGVNPNYTWLNVMEQEQDPDEVILKPGNTGAKVIKVASHDTASAVLAVPAEDEDFLYISSGTWSLMGIENKEPCLSEEAQKQNFTNEGGFDYSIRFLKNIMGLWIIQECRRQWQREGIEISFAEIAAQAEASACASMVDPDDASFELPGDMPERIREYCRKTGQEVHESIGDIGRVVYTSLAMKYRYTLENIAKITGKSYGSIHIVGGGCNATMLCRLAADCCNVPVYAGPGEATALGNIAVQLIALGELKDLKDARAAVARSEKLAVYQPQTDMSALYAKFLQIIGA